MEVKNQSAGPDCLLQTILAAVGRWRLPFYDEHKEGYGVAVLVDRKELLDGGVQITHQFVLISALEVWVTNVIYNAQEAFDIMDKLVHGRVKEVLAMFDYLRMDEEVVQDDT